VQVCAGLARVIKLPGLIRGQILDDSAVPLNSLQQVAQNRISPVFLIFSHFRFAFLNILFILMPVTQRVFNSRRWHRHSPIICRQWRTIDEVRLMDASRYTAAKQRATSDGRILGMVRLWR
jgi:hypothetical protein